MGAPHSMKFKETNAPAQRLRVKIATPVDIFREVKCPNNTSRSTPTRTEWGSLAVHREGRTIWIVDAHGYGKHFIVPADEKLTLFVEQEAAIAAKPRLLPLWSV